MGRCIVLSPRDAVAEGSRVRGMSRAEQAIPPPRSRCTRAAPPPSRGRGNTNATAPSPLPSLWGKGPGDGEHLTRAEQAPPLRKAGVVMESLLVAAFRCCVLLLTANC